MTLFRKVFQNQSRPADPEETLDEDALRAAFKEMRETREPLVLDPFEHSADASVDDPNAEGIEEYYDDTPESNMHETQPSDDEADPASERDVTYETDMAIPQEDLNIIDEDAEQTDFEDAFPNQTKASEHSDEDIVASLGRALAEAPEDNETIEDPSDDALIEQDLIDHASSLSQAEVVSDGPPIFDNEPMEEELTMVVELSADDATAAFAQQQMAALAEDNTQDSISAPPSEAAHALENAEMTKETAPVADVAEPLDLAAVASPAAGRVGRRAGRVKTRVLGFNRGQDAASDPFGATPEATATPQREKFPVGWLVIVEGPGVGHSFSIFTGASIIGRGEDQMIRLDFGDNSISRNNHAAIAYDEEQNKFYIGHGGKSNIIRRNARPVLSTEELNHADLIRIGETTLRFVALCGSDFQWNTAETADATSV